MAPELEEAWGMLLEAAMKQGPDVRARVEASLSARRAALEAREAELAGRERAQHARRERLSVARMALDEATDALVAAKAVAAARPQGLDERRRVRDALRAARAADVAVAQSMEEFWDGELAALKVAELQDDAWRSRMAAWRDEGREGARHG